MVVVVLPGVSLYDYPFWMQDDAPCCLGIPSCHFMVGDLLSECQASSAALAAGGAGVGGAGGAWNFMQWKTYYPCLYSLYQMTRTLTSTKGK